MQSPEKAQEPPRVGSVINLGSSMVFLGDPRQVSGPRLTCPSCKILQGC